MRDTVEVMDGIRAAVAKTRSKSLVPFLAQFDEYLAINIASFKCVSREDGTVGEFRFEFFDGSICKWEAAPPDWGVSPK